MNKGKILPVILLLAVTFSLVQGVNGLPWHAGRSGEGSNLALAAPGQDPIFLPFLFRNRVEDSPFGIDIGAIQPNNGLNQMVEAGAQWIRRGNYYWPSIEPNKGDRNWSALAGFENELATATNLGLKTILVVQNAPSWAQRYPGIPCGPVKQEEFAAFASFMHDLVARFSQPPYNIQYYEIFNEPDAPVSADPQQVFGCWGDTTDNNYYGGEYYGQMLKAVYPQVKSANPSAQVVLGGLLMDCDPINPPQGQNCTMSKFLEGVLKTAADSFDVLSFHTYDYYVPGFPKQYGNPNWHSGWNTNGPAMNSKLPYIHSMLQKYGVPNKPLMATEAALLCSSDCGPDFDATKASFVAQSFIYSIVNGLKATIWYDIFGGWRNNGILQKDLTPLPAYLAYKTAQSELAAALFVREVTGFRNVKVFEFNRGDRLVWALWSLSLDPQNVTLPSQPKAVLDVEGNTLPKDTRIRVTNSPIYVELNR